MASVPGRQLDRAPIAGREKLRFTGIAAAPHRSDGVDDEPRAEAPRARDLRIPRVAAAQEPTFVEDARAGGPMNRTIDATTAEQA